MTQTLQPRFAFLDDPPGGMSLRAKTVEKARAKIEALLEIVEDPRWDDVSLHVAEPCSPRVVEWVCRGPVAPNVGGCGPGSGTRDWREAIDNHGHVPGELVAEAVSAFGAPDGAGVSIQRRSISAIGPDDEQRVVWRWLGVPPRGALDRFFPFVIAHQGLSYPCRVRPEFDPLVAVYLIVSAKFSVAGEDSGSILAWLRGAESTMYLMMRHPLPDGVVDAAFVAFHDRVCHAIGHIPSTRWKLGWIAASGNLVKRKLGFQRAGYP